MGAAIEKAYGIEPELEQGSGGIFDVVLDGETIYSKWQTGRFPSNQEILAAIAQRRKTE